MKYFVYAKIENYLYRQRVLPEKDLQKSCEIPNFVSVI